MEIEFWPENPSNSSAIEDLKKLLNKKEQKWYLSKLEKYEQYPEKQLYRSKIIKKIQNWRLKEIRIKNIRFLGDILQGKFWVFAIEKKQRGQLPQSAFQRAKNIRDKFLNEKYEN